MGAVSSDAASGESPGCDRFAACEVASYDAWFDRNKSLYLTHLSAVGLVSSREGLGLEIGVGTGRFASPLGVEVGLDPCPNMVEVARSRGVEAHRGRAEALPFEDASFGHVLLVDTVSWLSDPARALDEIRRVLVDDGRLLISLPNPETPRGREQRSRTPGPAPLCRSLRGLRETLGRYGFVEPSVHQTLFGPPEDVDRIQTPREGAQDGSILVLEAQLGDGPIDRID